MKTLKRKVEMKDIDLERTKNAMRCGLTEVLPDPPGPPRRARARRVAPDDLAGHCLAVIAEAGISLNVHYPFRIECYVYRFRDGVSSY